MADQQMRKEMAYVLSMNLDSVIETNFLGVMLYDVQRNRNPLTYQGREYSSKDLSKNRCTEQSDHHEWKQRFAECATAGFFSIQ